MSPGVRKLRRPRGLWGRALLLALLLFGLVFVGLLYWPYQGYSERAVVMIEPGMNRRAIAERLAAAGVLRSPWPFLLYAYAQRHRSLKAGEYVFQEPLNAAEVFAKLVRGEVHLYTLVIPEGYTRWDIADQVAQLGLASRDAFLAAAENAELIRDLAPKAKNLEGYLFPDTYRFARPSEPAAMVRTMVERFREVYGSLAAKSAAAPQSSGPRNTSRVGAKADRRRLSPHELVTLASLVEKETGVPAERGLIAGVFYNRLARRWPLDCDPTVIYAARLAGNGSFDGAINVSDLERKSPYNTYLQAGLPPGPIASPGRAALEAVLNLPTTPYLFFVSNTQGGHAFATTGREHARNVARYRRLRERQQKAASHPTR